MVVNRESSYRAPRPVFFRALIVLQVLFTLLLSGCQGGGFSNLFPGSGLSGLYKEGLPGTADWAVLPFVSHVGIQGEVPVQLERMLMVQLPSVGVTTPRLYPESEVTTASSTLADAHRRQNARQWAYQEGVNFTIMGEIMDWRFEEDGRFLMALKLEVIDMRSGQSLWNISGRGEGLPGQDAYEVGRNLLADLLTSLPISRLH